MVRLGWWHGRRSPPPGPSGQPVWEMVGSRGSWGGVGPSGWWVGRGEECTTSRAGGGRETHMPTGYRACDSSQPHHSPGGKPLPQGETQVHSNVLGKAAGDLASPPLPVGSKASPLCFCRASHGRDGTASVHPAGPQLATHVNHGAPHTRLGQFCPCGCWGPRRYPGSVRGRSPAGTQPGAGHAQAQPSEGWRCEGSWLQTCPDLARAPGFTSTLRLLFLL